MVKEKTRKGLLIVNTGNGKGKTTAAFGMAVRNLGWDRQVTIIQFAKGGWETGELRFMKKCGVTIIPAWGSHRWFDDSSEEKRRELADEAMRLMREFLQDDSIDLLILDEINIMTQYHLIESEELLPLLRARPASMTAILTGRNAAPEIIAAADLVSEIHDVKHPISAGLPPQKGIEF